MTATPSYWFRQYLYLPILCRAITMNIVSAVISSSMEYIFLNIKYCILFRVSLEFVIKWRWFSIGPSIGLAQAITQTNGDPVRWHTYASAGFKELTATINTEASVFLLHSLDPFFRVLSLVIYYELILNKWEKMLHYVTSFLIGRNLIHMIWDHTEDRFGNVIKTPIENIKLKITTLLHLFPRKSRTYWCCFVRSIHSKNRHWMGLLSDT